VRELKRESPGRACEGRPVYRGRLDRRPVGRSHDLGATPVVPTPAVSDSGAACELASGRRRLRHPLAGCRWRLEYSGPAPRGAGSARLRTNQSLTPWPLRSGSA